MTIRLIDTHTHFDVPEYDEHRMLMTERAHEQGIRNLVLIGFLAKYFHQMVKVKSQMADFAKSSHQGIRAHLAFGLHPLYIMEQSDSDLMLLDDFIRRYSGIAIAEIGLDTYTKTLAQSDIFEKQKQFFIEQIHLAKHHDLPILLHIRKAHAQVLQILKDHKYRASVQGGIAHSFSGGEQEALAFVKMGFKLGITGQITNPNAKKLRNSVMSVFKRYGAEAFVIETDCPDMMPVPCQHLGTFNEPANLVYVLDELATMFDMDKENLARQLWQNSNEALHQNWVYE